MSQRTDTVEEHSALSYPRGIFRVRFPSDFFRHDLADVSSATSWVRGCKRYTEKDVRIEEEGEPRSSNVSRENQSTDLISPTIP